MSIEFVIIQNFELACEEVKNFVEKLNDNQKLEIYGYFKQATVGDNNTNKPGFLDFKGKSKWEAWNSRKGMSSQDAKINYVKTVKKFAEDLGLKDIAKNL